MGGPSGPMPFDPIAVISHCE
ncbi:DUF6053 domain-containing protein [Lysobacter gummosus]